ncbi:MAG: hypothetical protein M1376_15365 [Planctomycetes bacterium]|nr:hypothetical protein [Planctomycetota bacterium]
MNVEQLAALEEKRLNHQRSLVGDRETLYEREGVYAAWREMFGQYAALARKGDLEALKRALFFVWAERSMSHLMTGIEDLGEDTVREILGLADRLTRDGRLDAELEWMLPYYYLVEPSYLDRLEGLDALKEASRANPLLYRQRCPEASFDHRGQMGEYWKAEQAHLRRWP